MSVCFEWGSAGEKASVGIYVIPSNIITMKNVILFPFRRFVTILKRMCTGPTHLLKFIRS